jgi:hypothetical protein
MTVLFVMVPVMLGGQGAPQSVFPQRLFMGPLRALQVNWIHREAACSGA